MLAFLRFYGIIPSVPTKHRKKGAHAMKPFEVISAVVDERGITVAELSRRTGINAELLRRVSVNTFFTISANVSSPIAPP